MSIPVCFVFDLVDVLTRPEACFSSGNVQRSHDFLKGDKRFEQLDFDAIYHDSYTDNSNRNYIHNCRMAEVAVHHRLPLSEGLYAIVFRTKWDMETFRHLLVGRNVVCPHRLSVEQVRGSTFMSEGLYTSDLSYTDDKLAMTFHFPLRYAPLDRNYQVYVMQECPLGNKLFDKKLELDKPTLSIVKFHSHAEAIWTVQLERELAFAGKLQHARSEIFG
jgi:hypothetical protein